MQEERTKQGHTNNKAKQHNTPKAVTFPKKNELSGGACAAHVHEVMYCKWGGEGRGGEGRGGEGRGGEEGGGEGRGGEGRGGKGRGGEGRGGEGRGGEGREGRGGEGRGIARDLWWSW